MALCYVRSGNTFEAAHWFWEAALQGDVDSQWLGGLFVLKRRCFYIPLLLRDDDNLLCVLLG
jgi:hypothetical protein